MSTNKNRKDDEKAEKLETNEPLAEKMPAFDNKEVLEYLKETTILNAMLVAFHFKISTDLATTFLEELERKGMVFEGFGRLGNMKIYHPSLRFHNREPERSKMPEPVLPENFIDSLEKKDYQVLTILKIIEKTDSRFFTKFYDKGHDLYITPLEAEMPYGSPLSIDEQQVSIQVKAQQILEFWNKPKLPYTLSLEKKCELKDDELRIHRIEKFREGDSSIETMYVVRLVEDSFFSWNRLMI